MSSHATLPDLGQIMDLLEGTLAGDSDVKKKPSKEPVKDPMTAIYTDEGGQRLGACVCELELAACLGAVLTLVPAGTAIDAAAERDFPDSIKENLSEFLNIAAQLFRPKGGKHRVVFGGMYLPGQDLPEGLAAELKKPADKLDVEIEISNYTTGRMSLLTFEAPDA